GAWPTWVVVALAIHLALHGVGHLVGSVVVGVTCPGTVTGVALCLPLAAVAFAQTARTLPSALVRRGVLVGIVSYQPFAHLLLLPWLPAAGASVSPFQVAVQ